MKRLLSYSYDVEPVSHSAYNRNEQNIIESLQKSIGILEQKLHEAAFDEREKRAIQTIVIDGDDANDDEYVPMEIIFPRPIIKEEEENTNASSSVVAVPPDAVTDGTIPFRSNVSYN